MQLISLQNHEGFEWLWFVLFLSRTLCWALRVFFLFRLLLLLHGLESIEDIESFFIFVFISNASISFQHFFYRFRYCQKWAYLIRVRIKLWVRNEKANWMHLILRIFLDIAIFHWRLLLLFFILRLSQKSRTTSYFNIKSSVIR